MCLHAAQACLHFKVLGIEAPEMLVVYRSYVAQARVQCNFHLKGRFPTVVRGARYVLPLKSKLFLSRG